MTTGGSAARRTALQCARIPPGETRDDSMIRVRERVRMRVRVTRNSEPGTRNPEPPCLIQARPPGALRPGGPRYIRPDASGRPSEEPRPSRRVAAKRQTPVNENGGRDGVTMLAIGSRRPLSSTRLGSVFHISPSPRSPRWEVLHWLSYSRLPLPCRLNNAWRCLFYSIN